MHSHAKLYMLEARIAFTAAGALVLLVLALPAWVMTRRPLFRWTAGILAVVVVVCAAALAVARIWMGG